MRLTVIAAAATALVLPAAYSAMLVWAAWMAARRGRAPLKAAAYTEDAPRRRARRTSFQSSPGRRG